MKLLRNLITSNNPSMWMVNKRNITASVVLSTVQTIQAFLNVNVLPLQWWLTSLCISWFDLCLLISSYISTLLATYIIKTILSSFAYIVFGFTSWWCCLKINIQIAYWSQFTLELYFESWSFLKQILIENVDLKKCSLLPPLLVNTFFKS